MSPLGRRWRSSVAAVDEDATPAGATDGELGVDEAAQLLDEIEAELAAIGRAIDQITATEQAERGVEPTAS